jgi:hypothetical protein
MLAEKHGFEHIIKIMTQYQNGYNGDARVRKDGIGFDCVSCPNGCGEACNQFLMKSHVLNDCVYREIPCPYGCNVRRLYYKDIENHCDNICLNRKIRCKKCRLLYPRNENFKHVNDECVYRIILCPNLCGVSIQHNDMNLHMNDICTNRLILCPLYCQELVVFSSIKEHTKSICENRSILCPYTCGRHIMVKVRTYVLTC